MFRNFLKQLFGKGLLKPDSAEDVLVMPATEKAHKDYQKIRDAKRMRYSGVKIVFHGIVGKSAPEDQADCFEREYLKPNGLKVIQSDYQRTRSILTIQF